MTKLKYLRINNNMSINQMCKEIGVSRYKYKNIENNPLKATPSIALKISDMFSMSVQDIFIP